MYLNYLDFEKPVVELDAKIEELRHMGNDSNINILDEIERLESKRNELLKKIFANLNAWEVVQLARHPLRPHAVDYLELIFTDFDELHGDRMFSDDGAIVAGIARLDEQPVLVITEEKGRTTKERIKRNFGSPRPEGYRKALRLMKLAERFQLPIITFIDTQGAYPGIDAEERGQSEAIARNLFVMATLKTPIICVVIGEGGSGGALAIGVGDRVMMLQYSIYSVISPEGCASILWRSSEKASEAAASMKLTAQDAYKNKLIDEIIKEPAGGAHRDVAEMAKKLKQSLITSLKQIQAEPIKKLLKNRYDRLMFTDVGYKTEKPRAKS
jgi:acetyl-CoA carboxylase carboxyl transferase subunit alpha